MNKRLFHTLILLILFAITSNAQKNYEAIRSFTHTTDHIPTNDRRNDLNGTPCALVKIQVLDNIVRIEGNKIGDIVNKGVEKWVYLCKGSRNIRMHFSNHLPIRINFQDFDINGLESNHVYEIIIDFESATEKKNVNHMTVVDNNTAQLTDEEYQIKFACNTKSAFVYIDDIAMGDVSDTHTIKPGTHSIKITANGYDDYTGKITINRNTILLGVNLKEKAEQISNNDISKIKSEPSGSINGHEWVDLGLSVKWATCNIGAESPIEYGDYYAWGEFNTKSIYDWNSSIDCTNPERFENNTSWATYKQNGQKEITPTSGHDVARNKWGGTWRLPTGAEYKELLKKCKWKWTERNGVAGYTITGTNGNSIFIPAAGWRYGEVLYGTGAFGYYWTNSLSSDSSKDAVNLYFIKEVRTIKDDYRSHGRSVRPVSE